MVPELEEFVDKGLKYVINLVKGWLLQARDDSDEIEVFGLEAEMRGQVVAYHVHCTNRVRFSGLLVAMRIEPVDEKTENKVYAAM